VKAHAYCLLPFISIFLVSACSEKSETEFPSNSETLTAIPISELGEVGERVKQLGSGAPTDLDGDGIPEAQLTRDQKGGIQFETVTAEGGVDYIYEKSAAGATHSLADVNGDGMTDYQEDAYVDEKGRRSKIVYQYDFNFDGYPESRRTDIFDWDNKLQRVTEERDDEGNGDYIIVKQWTRKLWTRDDIIKKSRNNDEVSVKKNFIPVDHNGDGLLTLQSEDLGCGKTTDETIKNINKLFKATTCAFEQANSCFKEINRLVFKKFQSAYIHLFLETLQVTCGSHEKNYSAFTDTSDSGYIIFVDPEHVFKNCKTEDESCQQKEEEELCSLMLHELMHVAEFPVGDDHDGKYDVIYSCARHCGFCQNEINTLSTDCITCVNYGQNDPLAPVFGGIDPLQCGSQEIIEEGPCEDTYAVCHAGLGCISAVCEQCRTSKLYSCDTKRVDVDMTVFSSFCCLQCPSDCDSSNDFPCKELEEQEYIINNCDEFIPERCKGK